MRFRRIFIIKVVVKADNHNKRQIITINVVRVNGHQGLENNQSCAFWFLNDAPAREIEQKAHSSK